MNTEEGQKVEKILLAWKKAQRKKVRILQVLACSIALIASFACMPDGQWNVPVLVLFAVMAIVVCIAIAWYLLSARVFEKSIKNMLIDEMLTERFFHSIDEELSRKLRTQFYNQQYRLQLYITEKWFVLISTNASLICRPEDIRETCCHLDRHSSHFCMQLRLSNGYSWLCSCHTICQELLQCIQKEIFP